MSESTDVIPRIEETDMEIDLSAQELRALSDLPQIDQPEAGPVLQPARPAKKASRRKPGLHLLFVAAVGVVGATYVFTSPSGVSQPTADTSQPMAPSDWPPPQQLAKGETVRFANPFDTDEVFEFPAGTTQTEARDAVAEVLMKRAISRQKT